MASPADNPLSPPSPVFQAALAALGWLVPGAGFFLLGPAARKRGFLYLALVHLTFLAGFLLHGWVVFPAWNPADPGFSIVNNLTFLLQLLAGWPALLSLLFYKPGVVGTGGWLEVHALFELGSFYYLVAGALNYFIICQSLDRSRKRATGAPAAQ